MLRKLGIGFIALATMAPGLAAALGVGEYELNSYLNEPLHMTVELHDLGGLSEDEILANLATQEAFDAAGVDRGYFLNDLKFDVDIRGSTGVLHIRSKQPVREPYLNFLVEFLWPTGRLMREYTVLLDPPSYADSDNVQPAMSQPSASPATGPRTASEPTRRPAEQPARPQRPPTPADDDAAETGAAAQDTQQAGTYRVRPSDTMWRIAQQQRPASDVSVQQMMLAIQDNNPDAFINDNVNLVREGAVLRIPSENQVRRLSSRDALSRVASQNREWRGMRPETAGGQPGRAPLDATGRTDDGQVAGGEGQGQVTLVTPDSRDGVEDGDATGGRSGNANTAALQNELAIRDENLDRLNRENEELRSRLDALDEQVGTGQQLLEMRSEKIAALQAELRRLREEQDVDVDPSLLEAPEQLSASDVQAGDQGADDIERGDQIEGGDQIESDGQPASTDEDDEALALGAPAQNGSAGNGTESGQPPPNQGGGDDRAPTVTPPDKPEPTALDQAGPAQTTSAGDDAHGGVLGLVRDNLLYIGAALAVLLLLLLLAVRRRQSEAADTGDADEEDDDRIGDDFGMPIIAGAGDNDTADADLEEDLADDQMDPMERADVYVAYGQYPQAMDFLRNEINQAPERGDLKIRLLELLHESNDERGFNQQAALFAGTSPAVDAAIKRLGGDPGEHHYDADEGHVASPDTRDGDELSLDDLELDLASDLPDSPADGDDRSGAALAGAAGFAADREQSDPSPSDDDLELDDFDFTLDDEEPEPRNLRDETPLSLDDLVLDDGDLDAQGAAAADQDDDLAFSLDDESGSDDTRTAFSADELAALDDAETSRSEQSSRADGADGDRADDSPLDDTLEQFDDLQLDDLDVSLTDDRAGADEPISGLQAERDDPLADLSQSLNDDALELEEGAASDEAEGAVDDLDLEDLTLDDELADADRADSLADLDPDDLDDPNLEADEAPESGTAPIPPATAREVSDDMLGDDDDFDFLGETDENATKLDLARAYIDMGDAEGARDILNEVLSEGSDAQQGEAKELLARVS